MTNAIEEAREALKIFLNCAFPADTSIDPRGYSWCEAWLDEARPIASRALAALSAPAPSIDWKRVEEVRARHEYAEQKGGDLYAPEYCEWTFSQTHADRAFLLSLLPQEG